MADGAIAYFSMEIGLESGMPTYSGGLGVLAGDTIRAAAAYTEKPPIWYHYRGESERRSFKRPEQENASSVVPSHVVYRNHMRAIVHQRGDRCGFRR